MCANPQTADDALMYKGLAPRFPDASLPDAGGGEAHFVESVSKPED